MAEGKTWIVVLNDGETWTTMEGCIAVKVDDQDLDDLANDAGLLEKYSGHLITPPATSAPKLALVSDSAKKLWRDVFLRILDNVGGTAVADTRFGNDAVEDIPSVIEIAAVIADEATLQILKRESDDG